MKHDDTGGVKPANGKDKKLIEASPGSAFFFFGQKTEEKRPT